MSIIKKRLKILLYGNIFGAYRSQNLVKYLLDAGYRTTIISPEFYHELGEKKDILTKVLRALLSNFYTIELLIKVALADVVYLLPLNSSLISSVIWLSRLFRTKLIVEMYVSAYDTLVREKQEVPIDSRVARQLLHNDSLALSEADYIIHLSRYELTYWEKIFDIQLDKDKIFIAPLFSESELMDIRHRAARGKQLRMCWWGTLIPSHGISTILKALQKLKQKNIDFSCQLFGIPPKGKEALIRSYTLEINDLGLSEVVSIRQDLKFIDGSLPRYLIDNCDLALGIFGNTEKAKSAVPNKLIEGLSLGIPSLTMDTPALREYFEPGVDFWTCGSNPDEIAETMVRIAKNTADVVNWYETREKVIQKFSIENYKEIVQQVLDLATDHVSADR